MNEKIVNLNFTSVTPLFRKSLVQELTDVLSLVLLIALLGVSYVAFVHRLTTCLKYGMCHFSNHLEVDVRKYISAQVEITNLQHNYDIKVGKAAGLGTYVE